MRGAREHAAMPNAAPRTDHALLALSPRETIAIIGDSITQQHLYSAYIEAFLITRFPRAHLRFINLGWGGDTAPGGASRFDRDVAPLEPSLVMVNFGMNDGTYSPPQAVVTERWLAGIRELVARIRACGARPVLLSTSAVVESLGDHLVRYNETLAGFAGRLREYATQEGIAFIDLFAPCLDAINRARDLTPPLRLIPDGVHPAPDGQLVMAYAALRGMQLPPGLGRLTCSPGGMVGQGAVRLDEVAVQADHVVTTIDLPFLPYWVPADARAAFQLVPFQEELNPFTLDCSAWGLDACLSVCVDGVEVAVLPPGSPRIIDLASLDQTPWARRGAALWTQVQARFQLHFLAWRQLALEDPVALQALPSHGLLLRAISDYLRASSEALPGLVAPARHRLEVARSFEIGFTGVEVSPAYPFAVDRSGDFERKHPPETMPQGVAWRPAALDRWHLDLARHHGGGSNCVCYVRMRVQAATAARIAWMFGSDDGISVIINGERVLERNVFRGCTLGDERLEHTVPAGISTILLRITQGGGGWSVAVRARALDGGPVVPLAPG